MAKRLTKEELAAARDIPLMQALDRLGLYYAIDRDFKPKTSFKSIRLNISVGQDVREMIFTGQKWYDTRAEVGGGGALDLAVHLLKWRLTKAAKELLGDGS